MKYCKYILSSLLLLAFLLPMALITASASPTSDDWLFVNGVNISRGNDSVVVYRNLDHTGQNRWGYDVVVDAEGNVTAIVKSGEAEEGGTVIPGGGYVISATGNKIPWLESNIKVGDRLYFDEYTQRLFVYNSANAFNPYGTISYNIEQLGDGYKILEPENSDFKVDFVYSVTIDGNGRVIARGRKTDIPEGGTVIHATTEKTRDELIVYAPVGAICSVSDTTVTFTYNSKCLKNSLELAVAQATAKRQAAASQYSSINFDTLDTLITNASLLINGVLDYETVFDNLISLEAEVDFLLTEGNTVELRAAFHTPEETTNEEVRKTILSVKRSGLNTLILRVTNGYGTFIPLPEGNKFSQDKKFNNFDLLKSYIKNCDDEGISLVLCFDVYYNEYASIANYEWLSQTNTGEGDIVNKFFSPEDKEFKSYYLDYVKYVITNYDIDTIMFDSLRYPKFNEESDLGYDNDTLRKFAEAYDIPFSDAESIKTKMFDSDYWQQWVEFRCGLVTDMATSLSLMVREARSDINMFFVSERDTVPHFYMQQSESWIKSKLFDGVMISVYDRIAEEKDSIGGNAYYDSIIAEKCGFFTAFTGDDSFLFVGLESGNGMGSHLMNLGINDTYSIGADGYIFSSLADFVPRSSEVNLKSNSAVSPLSDLQSNVKHILDFAQLRIYNSIYKAEGCDNEILTAADTRIEQAVTALESGEFTYDQAKALESDMGVIFATSPAKSQALRDFKALTKMAKFSKVKQETDTPEEDTNTSSGEENEDTTESSDEEIIKPSETVSNSAAEESSSSTSQPIQSQDKTVNITSLLIYGFVAFAGICGILAVVVTVKRKKSTPSTRHMPKGSAKGYEDKK